MLWRLRASPDHAQHGFKQKEHKKRVGRNHGALFSPRYDTAPSGQVSHARTTSLAGAFFSMIRPLVVHARTTSLAVSECCALLSKFLKDSNNSSATNNRTTRHSG